jgi:hypothetical protein
VSGSGPPGDGWVISLVAAVAAPVGRSQLSLIAGAVLRVGDPGVPGQLEVVVAVDEPALIPAVDRALHTARLAFRAAGLPLARLDVVAVDNWDEYGWEEPAGGA